MKKNEVSIIVPVYNVEDYIDECMESIVSQTFSNIEILLIVGESTDGSTAKCRKWCQKDKRVRIIKEKQKGLGPARNQGIREAHGDYIAFIDSDDIVKTTYVEKMYNKITTSDADVVECDYQRIHAFAKNKEYVPCTRILKKELDIPNKLLLSGISMWKIMSKRELWLNNNIVQPFGPAEDFPTYPILLFTAKKIVNVSEDLYLYRIDSVRNRDYPCTNKQAHFQMADTMIFMIDECIKRQYFDSYQREIDSYTRRWISRFCSRSIGRLDHNQYMEIKQKYLEVYSKCFNNVKPPKEIVWGGFNLSRIVNKLPLIEDPYCRINFTSIISIMFKKTKVYEIVHKNKYREFMLKREHQKEFFDLLEEEHPKYFFFDLLEERHDILESDNTYFTKSDAFEETTISSNMSFRVIKRESPECQKLWEESCISFFEKLFLYVSPQNIIMVKNLLMEQYGDGENKYYFGDLNRIQKINRILRNYYKFVEDNFPDIQVIEVNPDDKYYYTDFNYEYGCFPWHLNEWENIEIAKKIRL